MTERIGVFGGTFDPPHLGHLILASEAQAQLHLARVVWILNSLPPHKLDQLISPLEDRLAMLKLTLLLERDYELSKLDIERPGPHYTLDTLKLLGDQYPGASLILLLGGDSLRDLPDWHRPAELVTKCDEIGVMRRPGDSIDLTALEIKIAGITPKIRFVDAPLLEIASHEIRRRVSEGMPFRYYVVPTVYDYILEHRLYQKS